MTTIKQGDRIRRVGPTTSYSGVTILHNHVYVAGRVIEGSVMLDGFPFSVNRFEKVSKADPIQTDEELAAENLRLYEEQRRISKILRERGYVKQWRATHRNVIDWRDSVVSDLPDQVRFIKTVTTTKVL